MQPHTEAMAEAMGVSPAWAGFKIPYFDPRGKVLKDFYRYRFWPTTGPSSGWASLTVANGQGPTNGHKVLRYVQPKNSELHVYMPPLLDGVTWAEVMKEPQGDLFITEGELKAACVCVAGKIMLGLGGVFSWTSKRHAQPLIPILEEFVWKGRKVFICFDSDRSQKPLVQLAASRLALMLTSRGAQVYDLDVPTAADGTKQGVDDYLVSTKLAAPSEAMDALLAKAEPVRVSLAMHKLNDEVAMIEGGGAAGNIVRLHDARVITPTQFTRALYRNRTYTKYTTTVDGGVGTAKLCYAADDWLGWPCRSQVQNITYAPGKPRIMFDGCYNLWQDTGVIPAKGDLSPWNDLLVRMFPSSAIDPKHLLWFKRWLAYPLRRPGTKLFSCALLWSHKGGTGKNLLAEVMVPIYGDTNCTLIDSDQLTGGFNGWAEAKQFIIGDEISLDDKRHTSGRLKSIITSRKIRINRKGIEAYEIPDCANYVFTSNDPVAMVLDQGERRTFVHHVPEQALGDAYGKKFMRWIYGYDGPPYNKPAAPGSGAAAIAYHLTQELDMGDFSPTAEPPDTMDKLDLIANSRSDIDTWAAALKMDPEKYLADTMARIKYKGAANGMFTIYTPEDLLRAYAKTQTDGNTRASLRALGIALDRAGFKKASHNNGRLGNVRATFWLIGTDRVITSTEAAKIYEKEHELKQAATSNGRKKKEAQPSVNEEGAAIN